MSKRSWTEARLEDDEASSYSQRASHTQSSTSGLHQQVATISRRVKACAACRKQKIKCIMDESGPPCRRCEEKSLGCVLNKSLQMLINERLPPTETLVQDLDTLHNALQTVLRTLNLPPLESLQSSRHVLAHSPVSEEPVDMRHLDEVGPSCDNSPKPTPEDDEVLPKVPIHSVYRLTKLSALRSPEAGEQTGIVDTAGNAIDDFISRGALPVEDAARLYKLYMDRLDHFLYGIGGTNATLDEARSKSRILTAAILTVAAMHDPQSNALYDICSKEFRRLMSESIFDRRISRDYLRAMCVASYWLSDISWMVSGYAMRRAAELNLSNQYHRLLSEHRKESADYVRLWYILYICDQHLSTLYGRAPVLREDLTVFAWEAFLQTPITTADDVRLSSQVALVNIVHSIKEMMGPDNGKGLPRAFLPQITAFSRQLDHWIDHWSIAIQERHDQIGGFPRKGAQLHFYFAKLHLYSHVFRGLGRSPIPPYYLESAAAAVSAATSIIDFITSDGELHAALAGMPSYLHSMTAFASMFLVRMTMIHGDSLVERSTVLGLVSRLVAIYHSAPVGKWHLVRLMAVGQEKILETLRQPSAVLPMVLAPATVVPIAQPSGLSPDFADPGLLGSGIFALDPNSMLDYDMNLDMSALLYSNAATFEASGSGHGEFHHTGASF
ncbi:hypothetical protein GQ53DRAFT_537113 [Thozetella sp. PMI_491]|nr:hypothetical protein GQ53DRAFT_537113 [Thozetella sp. PMI_491]